ncbi:MAG: caspase family protein [bacterium]
MTGGADATAYVWNVNTGDYVELFDHAYKIFGVDFSPDNERVVTSSRDNSAIIWDAKFSQKLHTMEHSSDVYSVDFSSSGEKILTASSNDNVIIWSSDDGKRLTSYEHQSSVLNAEFGPESKKFISASNKQTQLWNVTREQRIHTFQHEETPRSVSISPSGNRALVGLKNGRVEIWKIRIKKRGLDLVNGILRKYLKGKNNQLMSDSRQETLNKLYQKKKTYEENRPVQGDYEAYSHYKKRLKKYERKADTLTQRLSDYGYDDVKSRLFHYSFLRVFGKPELKNIRYDRKKLAFQMNIVSNRKWAGDFKRSVVLEKKFESDKQGREFERKLKQKKPVVYFDIIENDYRWSHAYVSINGKDYELIREQKALEDSPGYTDDIPQLLSKAKSVEPDTNHYLFAIGIENYSSAPDVPYALRTAKLFKKVARKRLGVPNDEKHMFIMSDTEATAGSIKGGMATLLNRLDSNDKLFFYYAGHGLPSRDGKSAYLLPQDAVQGFYKYSNFKLDHIYRRLARSRASRIIAFVDTCFSGQASKDKMVFDGVAPAGRIMKSKKLEQKIPDNITVMTAGKTNQFANAFDKRGHRLFSYYVMKGLLIGKKGNELKKYVTNRVDKQSRMKGPAYTQTPQTYGNQDFSLYP